MIFVRPYWAFRDEFFPSKSPERILDTWDWNWEPCGAIMYDSKTQSITI